MYQSHSLKEDLKKSLGPEWISSRSGPGGAKLMYLEGKTAINLANELFGYDGWSSQVKESVVDFFDISDDGKINLGIATTVRVTLKDGTYHEDIGYGVADNMKTKASAFEKARKESTTDGMKRALRMFGNALGNCVYDKTYLRNISTMARSTVSRNDIL
ncbi:DNA repair protein Rad52/59/22 [Halteromyces radiatus]|uniref:DNA repair protein Rad52/59/22 n=1 Tax=Halteromyces radiatus TaxID=101107 RepID=UPI0022200DFC|nr:DNA repair protein Rad52/59/22 [Halteromyces radiatus]KAI8080079.1 DNA repair protein Rad52/59/22 [Halteromyces radiatus]